MFTLMTTYFFCLSLWLFPQVITISLKGFCAYPRRGVLFLTTSLHKTYYAFRKSSVVLEALTSSRNFKAFKGICGSSSKVRFCYIVAISSVLLFPEISKFMTTNAFKLQKYLKYNSLSLYSIFQNMVFRLELYSCQITKENPLYNIYMYDDIR